MSDLSHSPSDCVIPDADELERTLAGESSPDERQRVSEWLQANPRDTVIIQMFLEEVSRRNVPGRSQSIESYKILEREIAQLQERQGKGRLQPSLRRSWSIWATMVGMGLGIAFVFWGTYVRMAGRLSDDAQEFTSTTTTENGQRTTLTLSDGTTVVLNVASRLEVPPDYMRGNRTLRLNGEALFTVAHHTETPFIVLTGDVRAQVLGTSFAVRRYDTDTMTTVAVQDGKVAVGRVTHTVRTQTSAPVVLTANEQVRITANGAAYTDRSDAASFSFVQGLLVLEPQPLQSAIVELNRWYDANIVLNDPTLGEERIGGTFAAGSLGDLSEFLELTFNARVLRSGRTLTVSSK